MFSPNLSKYDPIDAPEGSIDPLGMYSIADRLAIKLVPGFRERMAHPRFLTAMAVGAVICKSFDDEVVSSDETSEPYMIYEWIVVQALVQRCLGTDDIMGLPGKTKAITAKKNGRCLNAANYLKSASVMGFHGVYKTLANSLDIISDKGLGEAGDRIVDVWESEQGLKGFYRLDNGIGKMFRDDLVKVVRDSLLKSEVGRNWGWLKFNEIADRLAPYRAGDKEKQVLYDIISNKENVNRNFTITSLLKYINTNPPSIIENEFHQFLLTKGNKEQIQLLTAILHYEKFCRNLTNIFESVLFTLSSRTGKTSLSDLVKAIQIRKWNSILKDNYRQALKSMDAIGEGSSFSMLFNVFDEQMNEEAIVQVLLEFHTKVQRQKPPFGKQPWIYQLDDGSYILNPKYKREESLVKDDTFYVHNYRINALTSFLKDLKLQK